MNPHREPSPIVVQRYLPSYDFAFTTGLSTKECSDRLAEFLAHQERPRGFVLVDPRVDGSVSGSSFSFSRRAAAMGGSVRPSADGYFVPGEEGTIVVARVEVPRFWWFFDAFMLVMLVVSFGFSWYSLAASALLGGFVVVLSIGPTWAEGTQAAALLRRILS